MKILTEGAGIPGLLRLSNSGGSLESLVMDVEYLDLMREYLGTIHDEFAILYGVEGIEGFGMDIEYKVTARRSIGHQASTSMGVILGRHQSR